MSCSQCEWCWGANGQDLKPIDIEAKLREIRRTIGRDWSAS
jgi:hypothetical protein